MPFRRVEAGCEWSLPGCQIYLMLCAVAYSDETLKTTNWIPNAENGVEFFILGFSSSRTNNKELVMIGLLIVIILVIVIVKLV